MRILLTILTFFVLFFGVNPVFADSPPTLLSPLNNSEVTQDIPKLSWDYSGECYTKGSCYYVEIDDSETFSSVDKFTYTNNKYYSPQKLSYKKWYWHVKAKNPSGTWSAMSDAWSFTLVDAPPSSTPIPTQTPNPTPSQTPILSPTPTPTPQITPSPVSSTPSPQSTTSQQKTSAYQILAARAKQNHEATVAAVATASSSMIPASSPIIKVMDTGQINIIKIAGAVFLFVGITIMIFIFIKSNIKSKAL